MTWWDDAVVYEVYLRSFADADGDGLGDLAGLRGRLGYLRDLGVDALWVTPFHPTADTDTGYDVIDHRAVDPRLGTLAEFDELLRRVHQAGLKLIVDLVLNHVSSEHPWFRAGRYELFHVRPGRGDGPPSNWLSIFGGPAWTRLGDSGDWYLHTFGPGQPDLNYGHPEVLADAEETLRFWLDRGVDGVRFDAAGALVKADGYPDVPGGTGYADRPGVHELYRRFGRILREYDRLGVAETWGAAAELPPWVRPDELHQAFAMQPLFWPLDAAAWRSGIDEMLALLHRPAWVHGNHDVRRAATRWGPAGSRAILLLMLALPGSVYVYAGDERGLPEVSLGLPDQRFGARVPLPWKRSPPPYGFGPDGTAPWLPQPPGWGTHVREPALLREALRLRRTAWHGPMRWLDSDRDVLAFRRGDWRCETTFGPEPHTVWMSPNGLGIDSSSSLV